MSNLSPFSVHSSMLTPGDVWGRSCDGCGNMACTGCRGAQAVAGDTAYPSEITDDQRLEMRDDAALSTLGEPPEAAAKEGGDSLWGTLWSMLSLAGAASGAYHGYKRNNDSIGWAIGWFLLGGLFPVFTIPVSFAQGFGEPERKSNPAKRWTRRTESRSVRRSQRRG